MAERGPRDRGPRDGRMIWFFDKDGEKLRYEISHDRNNGRYRVVITHPDGSESVEEVDEHGRAGVDRHQSHWLHPEGLALGHVDQHGHDAVFLVSGGGEGDVDATPAADPGRRALEEPSSLPGPGVEAGPPRTHTSQGDAGAPLAPAERPQPLLAQGIRRARDGEDGSVVLHPHEGCREAAAGQDLDHLTGRGDVQTQAP